MKKLLFTTAALAAMLFASCSKDENGGNKAKVEGDVRLSVNFSKEAETRGLAPNAGGKFTDVNNISVFLTDATGKILAQEFSYGEMPYISIEDLLDPAKGVTFYAVTGGLTDIYVYANIELDLTDIYVNISEVKTKNTALLEDQRDFDDANNPLYFIKNVTMAGDTDQILPDGDDWQAEVEIAPILARTEIVSFKAIDDPTVGADPDLDLKDGYLVTGIFMDGYHTEMGLNGITGTMIFNGQDRVKFAPASKGGAYADADKGYLYDFGGTTITIGADDFDVIAQATGKVVEAGQDANNVDLAWGYNFIPDNTAYNRWIIKLENVQDENGLIEHESPSTTPDGEGYLTITYFYDVVTGTQITYLEPGKVYLIEEVTFHRGNVTDTPNPPGDDEKTVKVGVKVKGWSEQKVGAGLAQ